MHLFRVWHDIMHMFVLYWSVCGVFASFQTWLGRLLPPPAKLNLRLLVFFRLTFVWRWKINNFPETSSKFQMSESETEWEMERPALKCQQSCSITRRTLPPPSAWQHCCTLSLCDIMSQHVWTNKFIKALSIKLMSAVTLTDLWMMRVAEYLYLGNFMVLYLSTSPNLRVKYWTFTPLGFRRYFTVEGFQNLEPASGGQSSDRLENLHRTTCFFTFFLM